MDFREGGRRLVLTLAWITVIAIWLKGFGFSVAFANTRENIMFGGWVLTLIIGSIAGVAVNIIGLWIVDGFIGVENRNDEEENND